MARQESRLVELDALRGVAALSVVGFHYTTRFMDLYGTASTPSLSLPHGHYGVNLFFIISGFVIFMTLERTKSPMDFVVSRFSRLFPAYWVAVAMTFLVTYTFGLPGKEVTAAQATGNILMLHGLLHIPHVDGVYWTLEVELLFYMGMLALFSTRNMHRLPLALAVLLALRLAYEVAALLGTEWSWTLSRLLILKYLPWFALGIFVYQAIAGAHRPFVRQLGLVALGAIGCLAFVDGWKIAVLATCLALLVYAAASGRLPLLRHPVLVFFGTISYTLYLVHENIGWVVQRAVLARGGSMNLSILAALAVSIALATLLTRVVEKPAMKFLRGWYRARQELAPG